MASTDVTNYIRSGNYVTQSWLGTSQTYSSNTNYGVWAQHQTSMSKVVPSAGTYYATIFLTTDYSRNGNVTEETCSVYVAPAAAASVSSGGGACGSTVGTCNLGAASSPTHVCTYPYDDSVGPCGGRYYTDNPRWEWSCGSTACSVPDQPVVAPTCANGAANPPACTVSSTGACLNGMGNPPACTTPPTCANGATDYPTCTTGAAVAPMIPVISALWQGNAFLGPVGEALEPNGYTVFAQATSPIGANLEYYFEWSSDSAPAQWSTWVGSGSWGGVGHYANYAPGTYFARAWAVDQYGNWSASPSPWLQITLIAPVVDQPTTPTGGPTGGGTGGPGSGAPSGFENGAGIGSGSCTSVSLVSTPRSVEQGQNPTLTWSVFGGSLCASTCTGSGFDTGGAVAGSVPASVTPTPPSTSYAVSCYGGTYGPPASNPLRANATVPVLVPAVSLSVNGQASAARVNANKSPNVNVVWSSVNSSSCSITKNGDAWHTELNSAGIPDTVTYQTIYTIDCWNKHGTHATASVTVNVIPNFQEF
ncbi:MAG: hypothetical protein WC217_00390 [Candidatus Paceibacterota bacterium]